MTLTIPSFSLASIGPWLTLTCGAILILLLDALSKGRKTYFPYLSLAFLALAAIQTVDLWGAKGTDFARMVFAGNFAITLAGHNDAGEEIVLEMTDGVFDLSGRTFFHHQHCSIAPVPGRASLRSRFR